ncbi:MAG: peptidoglycan-binding domain-containing protein [Pseudomonadota bacterium]
MLPNLRTAAMASMLGAAVAAAPAGPALALGKNEQNFLKGVLAAVAVGVLLNQARKSDNVSRAPTPVYREPVYREPAYATPTYRSPAYGAPTYRNGDYSRIPTYRENDYSRIPSYGTVTPAARSAFLNYSPPMRRAIQARLADYGYYTGAIDGIWGPRTDAALRSYAADAGLSARLGSYSGAVSVLDSLAV